MTSQISSCIEHSTPTDNQCALCLMILS